ncbi:tetratricopeptide repeat protein [Maribacter luteus]|uniref:tetratricopeptide repeat protein n=1 Tax=Maribacter luteus TaxID=2594478 RepID=UPI00248F4E66|nr:hypothetical protein [Maribacter luteus]
MFFKKDIYKALRAKSDNSIIGRKFKNIKDIDYQEALVYPRFKFVYGNKPILESGIFETSDYKKLMEIVGVKQLSRGAKISYNKKTYEIIDITVDILDIVIDYSNGHTDYFIGNPIPFHIEINILLKDTNIYEIANEFAKKFALLNEKKDLDPNEIILLNNYKSEAERCYSIMIDEIDNIPEIFYQYAIFKSECNLHQEAIELMIRAIKLAPYNPQMNFELGWEYGYIQETELEYKYVKKASELGYKEAKQYLEENFPKRE